MVEWVGPPGAEISRALHVAAGEDVLADGFNVNSQLPADADRTNSAALTCTPDGLGVHMELFGDLTGR